MFLLEKRNAKVKLLKKMGNVGVGTIVC